MTRVIQSVVLAALVCGTAAATEDLDAALDALKKKARRRDYSSRANLADRDLTVPVARTDRDEMLDAKLRVMEQKLSGNDTIQPRPAMRAIRPLPRQEENSNWLTPALMDNQAGANSLQEEPGSWMDLELERQKNRQMEQATLAKEQELIDRQVNDRLKTGSAPQFNPADSYSRSLQDIIGSRSADEPRQPAAKNSRSSPIEDRSPFAIKSSSSPSLFQSTPRLKQSSELSRSSGIQSFSIKRSTLQTPTDFSSKWDKKPEPLTPLKKLRKSSLIDTDPFSDDFAPRINKSIWD